MPINSKQKGARGERDFARFLREKLGIEGCRRGQQYCGNPDSPDVVGVKGVHFEVKNVQALNLNKAMAQAVRDAGLQDVPVVASKRNHGPWLLTILAIDVPKFAEAMVRAANLDNPLISVLLHSTPATLADNLGISSQNLSIVDNKIQTVEADKPSSYTHISPNK